MPLTWIESSPLAGNEPRRAALRIAMVLLAWGGFSLLLRAQGPGGPPPADVSVGGLLQELCDPAAAIAAPKHPFRVQSMRSGSAPFARRQLDLGHEGKFDCAILAELSGPGALVELHCSAQKGRLFFLFDGDDTPRVDLDLENAVQGLIPAFRAPLSSVGSKGMTLRLPLTFSRDLKILSPDAGLNLQGVYRRYAGRPSVERFDMKLAYYAVFPLQEALGALPGAPVAEGEEGAKPKIEDKIKEPDLVATLTAGAEVTLLDREGAGVLTRFSWEEFGPFASFEEIDALELTVEADGQRTMTIPLTALFGETRTFRGRRGARRSREELIPRALRQRSFGIPMPFAQRLTLRLKNLGERTLTDQRFFFALGERAWTKSDRHLRARRDIRRTAFWGPKARLGWRRFSPNATSVAENLRFDGAVFSGDAVVDWEGGEERRLGLAQVFGVYAEDATFSERWDGDSETLLLREGALDAPTFTKNGGQDLELVWPAGSGLRRVISTVFWYGR